MGWGVGKTAGWDMKAYNGWRFWDAPPVIWWETPQCLISVVVFLGSWQISSTVWPITQNLFVMLKLIKDSSWRRARQIPAGIFPRCSRALLFVTLGIAVFLKFLFF